MAKTKRVKIPAANIEKMPAVAESLGCGFGPAIEGTDDTFDVVAPTDEKMDAFIAQLLGELAAAEQPEPETTTV